jgi:Family of unknown function (DUF6492)
MSSIALVTPTYWRDLELCKTLCESVDRYVTAFEKHYLIVADDELALFRRFNSQRRVVLPSSGMLPSWLKPFPRFVRRQNRRWWWSLQTLPVSGWHIQQVIKIAAARTLPEERYCMLDSDIVFFRPYDLETYSQPNRISLFRAPKSISADQLMHARWIQSSHHLLNLGEPVIPADDFIGHIIFWDQQTVRAMTERIEEVSGVEWVQALCRARDFSEYMLYGYYVQSSAQAMESHHLTTKEFCVSYWDQHALDRTAIESMLRAADEHYVAFSAASFSGTPIAVIREAIGAFAQPEQRVA